MTSAPTPPVIIANRYEIVRELGSGSFGQVLEVRDHTMDTPCALKLLSDDILTGPWSESQILRGLSGEFILPILNADVVQGRRYIVTEVMTGGTVDDRITPGVGMPTDQAVRWAREACQGVARVHDAGLIHGDVKPGNLFLDSRNEVLVGDFGLAQQVNEQGLARAVGTPGTMAPEVAAFYARLTPTPFTYTRLSDVYSLGATAYWMFAGQPPGVANMSVDARPDLWTVAPHVPRGLRDAVNRALAVDPAQRQASVSALAAELGLYRAPDRTWSRTVPHRDHEQCYSGVKGPSVIEVCVLYESSSRVRITGRHAASARRVQKAERTSSRSGLPGALRSVFRACR